LRVKTVLDHLQ